jgi:hypothetical protein
MTFPFFRTTSTSKRSYPLQKTTTRPRLRRVRVWLLATLATTALIGTVGVSSAPAFAQSAADYATARDLFLEGRNLRDAGKLQDALDKFKAANALVSTPITAIELGRTHELLNQYIEAREAYLSVARLKVDPQESDRARDARKEAPELAEKLRPKVPSLLIKIEAPPTVTARATVDGSPVPSEALSQPRKLNPGKHAIVVVFENKADNKQAEQLQSIDLQPSQPGELIFKYDPASAKALGPAIPEKPASGASSGLRIHPLSWAGFGVAAGGVILGSIGGGIALGKGSTLVNLCGKDTSCPPTSKAAVEDAQSTGRTWATVSTISFIVAGVGIGAGVVGFFLPQGKSGPSTSSTPADAASTVSPATPTTTLPVVPGAPAPGAAPTTNPGTAPGTPAPSKTSRRITTDSVRITDIALSPFGVGVSGTF